MNRKGDDPDVAALDTSLEAYARSACARSERAPVRSVLFSAAAASAAVAGSADATILYSGVQNIERTEAISGRYSVRAFADLDLDFDGADDVTIEATYYYDYITYGIFSGRGAQVATSGTVYLGFPAVRVFSPGESVTAGASALGRAAFYAYSYAPMVGGFRGPDPAIAGLQVNGKLGWIRLVFDPLDPPFGTIGFRIVDWAIETQPGVAIPAGAVPEPSTAVTTGLGLLALGARGVRRRRADRARKRSDGIAA